MDRIIPPFSRFVKERMCKHLRKCRSAAVRLRYLIVLNLWRGCTARAIEAILGVHNTTV
jgi:hypothetical protein